MRFPRPDPSTPPTAVVGRDLVALLADHHLALVGTPGRCRVLVDDLASRLATQSGVQMIRIDGRGVQDLGILTRRLTNGMVATELADPQCFVELVKALQHPPAGIRHQFFVWSDADELISRDRDLFARLIDAICTVAAEREYVTTDPLVIQRLVLTGGPTLEAFARQWSGEQPPMLVCAI